MRDRDTLRRLTIQRAMFDRHAELAGAARADEYARLRADMTKHIRDCDDFSELQKPNTEVGNKTLSKFSK
jgi:hypothetical protein